LKSKFKMEIAFEIGNPASARPASVLMADDQTRDGMVKLERMEVHRLVDIPGGQVVAPGLRRSARGRVRFWNVGRRTTNLSVHEVLSVAVRAASSSDPGRRRETLERVSRCAPASI
jgi:hypothetical protein